MSYRLIEMRLHVRALIGDPDAKTVTDAQLRDDYINPSAIDWWRYFEDRPGFQSVGVAWLAGLRSEYLPMASSDRNQDVYRVTVSESLGGEELAMRRSEWNRVRWLQETEGAIGMPREWGAISFQNGGFGMQFAIYPLMSQQIYLYVYSKPSLAPLLSGDFDTLPIDPLAARFVSRLAAYRLGLDLKLKDRLLKAILAPFPRWARDMLELEVQLDRKGTLEDQPGAARHLVAAEA